MAGVSVLNAQFCQICQILPKSNTEGKSNFNYRCSEKFLTPPPHCKNHSTVKAQTNDLLFNRQGILYFQHSR